MNNRSCNKCIKCIIYNKCINYKKSYNDNNSNNDIKVIKDNKKRLI